MTTTTTAAATTATRECPRAMTKRTGISIVLATTSVVVGALLVLARAIAVLPSRLDDYLMHDDRHFCRRAYDDDAHDARGILAALRSSQRWERHRRGNRVGGGGGAWDGGGVVGSVSNYILHRISSRLWTMASNDEAMTIPMGGPPTSAVNDDEDDVVPKMHPMCEMYRDLRRRLRFRVACIPWNWYRATSVRIYGLALRGVTVSTTTTTTTTTPGNDDSDDGFGCESVDDDGPGSSYPTSWTMGWIGIGGGGREGGNEKGGGPAVVDLPVLHPPRCPRRPHIDTDVAEDDDASCGRRDTPLTSVRSSFLLPPSIYVEYTHLTIRSAWSRPIVSVRMSGIALSVVVRGTGTGGGSGLFPSLIIDPHGIVDGTTLLFGDMTLREFVAVLPKPPDVEGTYPRIGTVNVVNVTLFVYEYDGIGGGGSDDDVVDDGSTSRPSLRLLFHFRVPDEFFVPITELTLGKTHAGASLMVFDRLRTPSIFVDVSPDVIAGPTPRIPPPPLTLLIPRAAYEHDGIDRKHFQPMVETSISVALRRHLSREAKAAIRDSWVAAHRAHEHLQSLILHAQGLYVDKWMEMAARAWRQGVVDGAAPVVRAVEDWLVDIQGIVREPIHPLTIVLSHHWNRTVDAMDKHGMSIDRKLLDHLNRMADRAINGQAILKHLNDLREAVDVFIAKSGQEVEHLVKEMWLGWHRDP